MDLFYICAIFCGSLFLHMARNWKYFTIYEYFCPHCLSKKICSDSCYICYNKVSDDQWFVDAIPPDYQMYRFFCKLIGRENDGKFVDNRLNKIKSDIKSKTIITTIKTDPEGDEYRELYGRLGK